MSHSTRRRRTGLAATLAMAAAAGTAVVVTGGCGGRMLSAQVAARDTVGTDVFVGPVTEPTARLAEAGTPTEAPQIGANGFEVEETVVRTVDLSAGFEGVPGSAVGSPDAEPVGPRKIVEAKVGDINGLPIFASEFLEPLAGRFRAEAERMSPREWSNFAFSAINEELNDLVLDELLRAEAIERLSPEQQAGLRGFLGQMRQNLESQNEGSRQVAERRLREQAGLSLQDWEERQRQRALVEFALRERINKRVSVSWRDIVQRYDRDSDRFRPDPRAVFRVIAVPTREAEDVAEATRLLGSGEPFEDVAALPLNRYSRDTQGQRTFEFDGNFDDGTYFAGPLDVIAHSLSEGEAKGPEAIGSLTYWIKLETINDDVVELYKAQSAIDAELRAERTQEELQRFISQLTERANKETLSDILFRLHALAIERYGRKEAPAQNP